MAVTWQTCRYTILLVLVLGVVFNVWWWHYKHVLAEYNTAVRYWDANCLDVHAVAEQGKFDDCHRRGETKDAGVFWVSVEALVRGFFTALKLAIWDDFLDASVVKLIFTLFGLLAVAATAGLLYLFQRDLEARRAVLLPNHSHDD